MVEVVEVQLLVGGVGVLVGQSCHVRKGIDGRGRGAGILNRSFEPKQASRVEDCDDLNKRGCRAIHDTVMSVDHLTKRFIADLRNHLPRKRKGTESIHRGHDPFHEQVRLVLGIPRHEESDGLDVLNGLRRPKQVGH